VSGQDDELFTVSTIVVITIDLVGDW
jgi:hypothetical protein